MSKVNLSKEKIIEIIKPYIMKQCFEENIVCKPPNISIFAEKIEKGDLFIALDSSKYSSGDGGLGFTNDEDSVFGLGGTLSICDKIDCAIYNGASSIIVDDITLYKQDESVDFILVSDCLKVLMEIAIFLIKYTGAKIIAVTGSTGKTTTTAAIYNFLSLKFQVKRIHRIRNSVLAMIVEIIDNVEMSDDFWVIEMQVDALGQVENFCRITKPDYAIITSINLSHHSRINDINKLFQEKIQVYKMMSKTGKCLVNYDDKKLCDWKRESEDHRIISIGKTESCYITIKNIRQYGKYFFNKFDLEINNVPWGTYKMKVPGDGIILATAFALFFAIEYGFSNKEIEEAIFRIENSPNRLQGFQGLNNSLVITDSYNANYYSFINGFEYINRLQFAKKILVLGSMMELGEKTEEEHKKVGKYIEKFCDIYCLITFGEAATYIANEVKKLPANLKHSVYCYEDVVDIFNRIIMDDSTVIYLKGGGAMRMELLLPYLLSSNIF